MQRHLKGSVYETKLSRIFVNYCKGWLLADAAAMGPSVFEVVLVLMPTAEGSSAGNSTLVSDDDSGAIGVGIARSAKLAKASKLARASRVGK